MLDYGKRNKGFAWVPKQSPFRNVVVYLLDGLAVISPDGSKLGIPLAHGIVTEKGEDPIARISQPAMGCSVKLVHEAEAELAHQTVVRRTSGTTNFLFMQLHIL